MENILKSFRLDGKTALVTGASHGIGFAMAKALSNAGAKVIFNSSSEDGLKKGLTSYRKENIEFHQQLTVAEQYYREYRYNKTLEIIRTSLEKVEPGAYERIRNSVKPR